jgi:hypothetical protein
VEAVFLGKLCVLGASVLNTVRGAKNAATTQEPND